MMKEMVYIGAPDEEYLGSIEFKDFEKTVRIDYDMVDGKIVVDLKDVVTY